MDTDTKQEEKEKKKKKKKDEFQAQYSQNGTLFEGYNCNVSLEIWNETLSDSCRIVFNSTGPWKSPGEFFSPFYLLLGGWGNGVGLRSVCVCVCVCVCV